MPDEMKDTTERIVSSARSLWENLAPAQRLAAVAVATAIFVGGLATVATQGAKDDYRPLFTNLSLEDTGLITERLDTMQVSYRLDETGGAIHVPSGQVVTARVTLAKDGFPRNRRSGLQLLASSPLGETQKVQDAKIQRALEEEIESTLIELVEIRDARVHLAVARDALFKEDRYPTTAAVMLTTVPGAGIDAERIDAVRRIVAASVSGLDPTQVTITDDLGRLLAQGGEEDMPGAQAGRQLSKKQEAESYLTHKVEGLLASVLGPDKASVAVDVVIDFDAVDREVITYDPESASVRSEERKEETAGADASVESSLTNYELNSSVERVVSAGGSIDRISAAVFVEGTFVEGSEGAPPTYVPRAQEEIASLTAMVQSAIGYDATRGDQVTVMDQAFDRSQESAVLATIARTQRNDMIYEIAWRVLLLLSIVALYFPLRGIVRSAASAYVSASGNRKKANTATAELEMPPLSPEEQRHRQIHEEIDNFAQSDPETIGRLLRTWLNEDAVQTARR